MKKILVLMAGLLTMGLIKADGLYQSPKKLAELIKVLPSKNILQPADLTRKWINFHIDRLKLVVKESEAMRDEFSGAERAKWEKVVNLRKELVKALEEVPVKEATKSLKYMPDWLALDARKLRLLSEQLRSIAKQAENKSVKELLEKKAKYVEKKGKKILEAISIAKGESKPEEERSTKKESKRRSETVEPREKRVCSNTTEEVLPYEEIVEPTCCTELSCSRPVEYVEYSEPATPVEEVTFVE